MAKKKYTSPALNHLGAVEEVTGLMYDSSRVDENEATGGTGLGSFDICYLGSCTPEKGDRRG